METQVLLLRTLQERSLERVGGSEPVLQVFKTMNEEHFGELSFFRIYSGQITTGGDSFNANRNITERIGQIFMLNGQTREPVPKLSAGDIGATVKLKNTHTGDTLCAPNHLVKLPVPEYPRPNIHAALQLKARGEEDKVATGLAIDFEHTMAPSLIEGLRALGHQSEATVDPYMDFGSGQFIWRLSDDAADGYVAASDSRRDGQAVGF